MKILVLGERGMLGRAVARYFGNLPDYEVVSIIPRFGEKTFLPAIQNAKPDFIVNGIGKIPQKKPAEADYTSLNIELPRVLETLNIPILHPSTDCEFKGDIAPGLAYSRTSLRDADDIYGLSKATSSQEIETSFHNTKIIRTSIIGHEAATNLSLLDWFLSQDTNVKGYTNHFWNGITTLQWAKEAHNIMENWSTSPNLNQFGTEVHHSKYDLLTIAKAVYKKDTVIIPFATEVAVNKCLTSDTKIPELTEQLAELKVFFGR